MMKVIPKTCHAQQIRYIRFLLLSSWLLSTYLEYVPCMSVSLVSQFVTTLHHTRNMWLRYFRRSLYYVVD
jgi:hypothetical protein